MFLTIRELGERDIVLRSLREGIDTSNATGRMVAGVLASLAELELEFSRDAREVLKPKPIVVPPYRISLRSLDLVLQQH